MSEQHLVHDIAVAAPPGTVYALLADATGWPALFPPTVHAEVAERTGDSERLRLWATANGAVKAWTSRRTFDAAARRITFRQEVSAPPVASMGGTWIVDDGPDGGSHVTLTHDYRAVEDDPQALDWISAAVDRNSTAELAALKAGAEQGDRAYTFEDSVEWRGTAADAYAFIWEADRWTDRLPHVRGVDLRAEGDDVQVLRLETLATDGSSHTTESVRVGRPGQGRIVYKQLLLPTLVSVHLGQWTFEEAGGRVRATSRHTVVLKPGAPEDRRAFVREALGANSLATLRHAAGVSA
ncbi:aromatase/cyclase [Dactylosporangium sp. NPDC048998]|uniref:aromatase/cyclase n=1 Tax=Dactylosporangium sp. NPDC048998 TaxID=3363976 RepID=UPI0037192FDB